MSAEGEDVRDQVVERGFLEPSAAEQAFRRYRGGGALDNFGSFLLEEGLLSLDQLAALSPAGSGSDSVSGSVSGESTVAYNPRSRVGEVVSGCRIEEKLGSGAMGSVFLARRESDGREVVVKFLDPLWALRKTSRARFIRTAQLVQGIHHPNVAAIYGAVDADPEPYCLMELVQGEPLGERLARLGPLDWREAFEIGRGTALGLAAAHAQGILHRDIKPDNLLVTPEGVAKVIDFGLAKNTLQDEGLSHAGQVLGTPYYMAPEQWGEHEVDARCDIFSLGTTLFHLLTGELPFQGERPMEIAHKIVKGHYPAPRSLRPDLPEDVELVLHRMLEPDRRFRYATMDACREDFEAVLGGQSPDVPRLDPAARPLPRFPLVYGTRFRVGRRSKDSDLHLKHASVSRQHALIRREPTGFVLQDQGSSYGTFVADQRVREIVLKDGDRVLFGKLPFVFRAGRQPPEPSESSSLQRSTRQVGEVFLDALIAEADKQVIVSLIERLAPGTQHARLDMARRQVETVLGAASARKLERKLEAVFDAVARRAPARLFMITREKLGEDPAAWLAWWAQTWSTHPPQLGPVLPNQLPRPRLRLVKGEDPRLFVLAGEETFTLGRDDQSAVKLDNLSVSRLHATIMRLDQRMAISDAGSRFGTLLNGERVSVAFLAPNDQIQLGGVVLEFEAESVAAPPVGPTFRIEPMAFDVLVEVEPRATILALLRFLSPLPEAWIETEAARIGGADETLAARLRAGVERRLGEWRERANEVLPTILGEDLDPTLWREAFRQLRPHLPPQGLPVGWGLEEGRGPTGRIKLRRPSHA